MGLAEFGPRHKRGGEFDNRRLLNCLRDGAESLGFFNYWHSWEGAKVAIVDNRHATALMRHTVTKNLDQLARRLPDTPKALDHSRP